MIVLIAVTERQVPITDTFNPNPITGRQAIFARVNTATQTGYSVEVVGCYTNLEVAAAARTNHARSHPGRKYVQKVCQLDDNHTWDRPAVQNVCILCQVPIAEGSFCPACHAKRNEQMRAMDPLGGAGDVVGTPQTSVGQFSTILNGAA